MIFGLNFTYTASKILSSEERVWILTTGFWANNGIWDDASDWID